MNVELIQCMIFPEERISGMAEVLLFMTRTHLFSRPADIQGLRSLSCVLETNKDNYFNAVYTDPCVPESKITMPSSWLDIVGEGAEIVIRTSLDMDPKYDTFFSCFMGTLMRSIWAPSERNIRNYLEQALCLEVLEDSGLTSLSPAGEIYYMVDMVIRQRLLCGALAGTFFENAWQILQLGAYPFGWQGGKDGMLVAYVPPPELFEKV